MKTILKLHANGDFETVNAILNELENLFVKSTTIPGYVSSSDGTIKTSSDGDRTSVFIPVTIGQHYTLQVWWNHTNAANYSYCVLNFYDKNLNFVRNSKKIDEPNRDYYATTFHIPDGVAFIRVSSSFLETGIAKMQFLKSREEKPYTLAIKDLESLGFPLYSFNENTITVPKIIEYPPQDYRNYFIEKTSSSGYISHLGVLMPATDHDRTSDFIAVTGWENGVMRIRFENMDGSYPAWARIVFFDASKQLVEDHLNEYITSQGTKGDIIFEYTFPANVAYIRVSMTYYDHPTANVKVSVEKGTIATRNHYLAFEDMPEWFRDTGQPISFFKEGVVIKGNLIQTNNA